jgi:hypothetical protein
MTAVEKTWEQLLREWAVQIDNDGTPSQVGPNSSDCFELADEIIRLRTAFAAAEERADEEEDAAGNAQRHAHEQQRRAVLAETRLAQAVEALEPFASIPEGETHFYIAPESIDRARTVYASITGEAKSDG